MKPLLLTFQAFASYAEETKIDFTKLDSLFLIHGETGAGKTAILDAMMYALYGESSGGDRSTFRCALPKVGENPTKAEFVFEIRGDQYKFTHSIVITPRSKKEEPKQDCFYFDKKTNGFRAFAENPTQSFVRKKAEELTGLSAEQFRQVIILPQGRFERLLTSGSEDKEEILSTLFSAEKYSRLSDKLHEKAEEERRALDMEENSLKTMLAGENADSPEKLSEEIENISLALKELSPRLESAKKTFADSREALTAAELLSKSFAELSSAKKQLSELEARSEEIAEIKRILSLHERSQKAKPEYAAFLDAGQTLNKRSQILSAAEEAFSQAEKNYSLLLDKQEEISGLERNIADKTKELTLLNDLADVYKKIGAAEEALAKISTEYSSHEKSLVLSESSLKKIDREIAEINSKRDFIISEFSAVLPELQTEKAALETGAENAKNLLMYEAELIAAQTKISELTDGAEASKKEKYAAESEYDKLYASYISNAAAELSSQLKANTPCPVCGSLSHPAPAQYSGDIVTAEQVKAARDRFEQASEKLAEINRSIDKENEHISTIKESISACRKVIEETGYTPEKFSEISSKCDEAEKQISQLSGISSRLSSLGVQKQSLEESLASVSQQGEILKSKKTKAETELAVLKERLDPKCPDQTTYALRISGLKNDIEAFSEKKRKAEENFRSAEKSRIECEIAFEQAKKERAAAAERLEKTEKAFFEKLSDIGISDKEQYERSLLPEETAAKYSSEAERYSMEYHSAKKLTESLSEKLEGKLPPDLDKIKTDAANAESLCNELSRQETLFSDKLSRLKKLSEEYSKRFAVYEAAREKSGRRSAFAKFMRGDKGISFTRYVLSIMLNLVVCEANRILADIHGGMFRLCVKTGTDSRSKQGLDLEVENTALSSSVKYGVKDLSGGEKFLISLALSLGLSSVAQSRAGGIEIEAMFIDEGFGSLDPNSLREAVSILCGLSIGRNTIGIISHVEELRNVIPCGIKITKTPEGGSKIAAV